MGADTEVTENPVIFFDGVCNLCNGAVNFVIDRDSKKKFRFASLQSDYAHKILSEYNIKSTDLESIVMKKADKLYNQSDAVLEIVRDLGGIWAMFHCFKILPKGFRDWLYHVVAKRRYKWFGKRDTCRVPTPELKERFLGSSDVS